MAIIATSNGAKNYEPVEAGTYAARCYSMVHIGTVTDSFEGKEKQLNKVRLSWELPTELKVFKEENGEEPYSLGKSFTLSMHEKATLRKFLAGWRGKDFTDEEAKSFDITKLLGVPCMISVIHKVSKDGKKYAEISSLSRLPKGMECPEQINPSFEFSVLEFDQAKFDTLPEWLQNEVRASQEYKNLKQPNHQDLGSAPSHDNEEDDLPF
jgi:hypothetical protein